MNITLKLVCLFCLIVAYYHYFKKLLHYPAYYFATRLKLTKKYSVEEAKGAVGFILVVMSHGLFAMLLIFMLDISYTQLGCSLPELKYAVYGLLLGLGLAGTAMIICLFVIKAWSALSQTTEQQMMAALPGGWLKSYAYVKLVTPAWIYLPAILLQLSCEELIFRSIFINYLLSLGYFFSIMVSALFFTGMQIFLMATLRGALFPVLGALLIGIVHGYLFLIINSIWPFIISHSIFFILFTA